MTSEYSAVWPVFDAQQLLSKIECLPLYSFQIIFYSWLFQLFLYIGLGFMHLPFLSSLLKSFFCQSLSSFIFPIFAFLNEGIPRFLSSLLFLLIFLLTWNMLAHSLIMTFSLHPAINASITKNLLFVDVASIAVHYWFFLKVFCLDIIV